MLTFAIAILTAVTVMALFPETGSARLLRGWLVEAPARWLNRLAFWRMLFFGGLIAVGLAMTVLFGVEGLMVYGMMAPEILIWALAFDVGLLIDALLISAAILASNAVEVANAQARRLAGRCVAALRLRRAPRTSGPRATRQRSKPAADDDPTPWAQPAYLPFSMA